MAGFCIAFILAMAKKMAEARIKVYNMTILSRQTINIFSFSVIGATFALLFLLAPKTHGQVSLQPSASSLQPQTGQAQAPNSNLSQTGAVQNNSGGQSFLNQSGLLPLGVVSDPDQTSPDAVTTPGQIPETSPPTESSNGVLLFVAGSLLAVAVIGVTILWRSDRKVPVQPVRIEETVITPEPVVKRPKKDKQSRKKRRKAGRH